MYELKLNCEVEAYHHHQHTEGIVSNTIYVISFPNDFIYIFFFFHIFLIFIQTKCIQMYRLALFFNQQMKG